MKTTAIFFALIFIALIGMVTSISTASQGPDYGVAVCYNGVDMKVTQKMAKELVRDGAVYGTCGQNEY